MVDTFITVDAANSLLRSMVDQQVSALGVQQRAIEALNAETRDLINKTRDDVNQSLIANKQAAEAHAIEQVGALRAQTDQSVNHIYGNLDEMRSLLLQHDRTRNQELRIRSLWSRSRSSRRK